MRVRDVMTPDPITVSPDDTLQVALERMTVRGSRHLPVVDSHGRLAGIVSDRDCRLALNSPTAMRYRWQDEEVTQHTSVLALMTPAPITVAEDATVQQAAEIMLTNHISALPVCRGETLVGIVTTSDLLGLLVKLGEQRDE